MRKRTDMRLSFRSLARPLIALTMIVPIAATHANTVAIERLRAALDANELEPFVRELEAGVIDADLFARDVEAYEVLCRSTHPDRMPFLDRLLAFGIDPSIEDPERVRYTFSPLACVYRENGLASFERLLDAGADSNISVCPNCADSLHTLVNHVLNMPELFDMIVERRELTPVELASVALSVTRRYIHKTWKGQPLNEYYADYLRERGYEIVSAEPRSP